MECLTYAGYALFTGFVISNIVLLAMVFSAAKTCRHIRPDGVGQYGGGLRNLDGVCHDSLKKDFSFLGGMLTGRIGGPDCWRAWSTCSSRASASVSFSPASALLVFSSFILTDTQKILKTYPSNEHVAASMTLFLNFVLLFVEILRLIILIAASGDD